MNHQNEGTLNGEVSLGGQSFLDMWVRRPQFLERATFEEYFCEAGRG